MPALALLLAASLPAAAFDDAVLHYYGNNSTPTRWLSPSVIKALTAAGATRVDDQTTWPSSLDDYHLVILSAGDGTGLAFSASQVADLEGLLARGGMLLIQGENAYFDSHNAVFNDLLADLGSTMSLGAGFTHDSGCGHAATLEEPAHPLLAGVSGAEYAASTELYPGAGTLLMAGLSGFGLIAVEGSIVLSSDSNILVDSCTLPAGNLTFAQNLFLASGCSDDDSDGFTDASCGGEDCADDDPAVNPGASETWYDGIDADCAGDGDYDADADEHDSSGWGGGDCDDADASVYPGADETWYDGVDADCAGDDDNDADADGSAAVDFGGDDCDDADPAVNPGASETWYDGIDADCAGDSDYDADADEHDSSDWGGDDCDDADASSYPGASDAWYDGVDADCAGDDDNDADADGYPSADAGGDDCDDADASVHPGAEDDPEDGIDQDCDGASEGAAKEGCACSAASSPLGLAPAALLAGLALLRRRRDPAPR